MSPYTLDTNGYFRYQGQRLVPLGVNYWPASVGVEMWRQWRPDEIQHDLDLLHRHGLNTIRFFLRWQDFEPNPGQYAPRQLDRLETMLAWCAERGLHAHPSLFVGFMSGGEFWPSWREQRNIFADPFMRDRANAFARRMAEVMRPHEQCILAIDQGNELCCLPDSRAASPAAVRSWCAQVNEAIRSVWPDVLLISGNEQTQVTADTGWRLGDQPGCDLYSMHTYPVPRWHGVSFDGMTDPLAQSLLPFYIKAARRFGPVFVQEFGTIVTYGARQQETYLRGMLPAAWQAGANGFLWWCMRDIRANGPPYASHGFETTLGLFDADDGVKPGLEHFLEFGRSLASQPAPSNADSSRLALYWPAQYYHRDQHHAANRPENLSQYMIVAHFLLNQLGIDPRIVGPAQLDETLETLVVPSALVTAGEIPALLAWVRAGGRLLWHAPDPVNWDDAGCKLIGAKPVDYRMPLDAVVTLSNTSWRLSAYPRDMCTEVAPTTATVLAEDARGIPMVLHHRVEEGEVLVVLPSPEATIGPGTVDPRERQHWSNWFDTMLQLLDVHRQVVVNR